MYHLAAPCIKEQHKDSNLERGIELYYPSFKIKAPRFHTQKHYNLWIDRTKNVEIMRWSQDNKWAIYQGVTGQTLIFNNVYIEPILGTDELWTEDVCIGKSNSHSKFFKTSPTLKVEEYEPVGNLIVSTTPDSDTFQHFTDRATVVWSQGSLEYSPNEISFLSGKEPTNNLVKEMYKVMVKKHYHLKAVHAEKVIYSCRSPLIHPFTLQKISEQIFHHYNVKSNIPYEKRRKIVYFTRSNGDINNKERRLLNEDEILKHLKRSLEERNKGEEIVIFDRKNYPNLEKLLEFFSGVKAVFGPHGASFYNTRFAPRKLAVLEIQPKELKFFRGFWEQASLLEQYYGSYFANNVNEACDMEVQDISGFVQFLLEFIDECATVPAFEILQKHYHWIVK